MRSQSATIYLSLLVALSALLTSMTHANTPPVVRGVTPTPIITWDNGHAWEVAGSQLEEATHSHHPAQPSAFTSPGVINVDVPQNMQFRWSVQMRSPITRPVRQGDILYASFWMRCLDSMTGQAFAELAFERAGPDHDKSISIELSAGRDWQRFEVPFTAHTDFQPGEAQLVLQLGYDTQQLEIAGVELHSYGQQIQRSDLPDIDFSYEGSEPDAAWRAEAARRIDQIRKSNLTLTVTDSNGRPLPNTPVTIRLTRHSFPFGTAVAIGGLVGQAPDDIRYRQILKDNFNHVVFENAMKWNNHNIGTPEEIDRGLAWLNGAGIPVRGHVLIWPGWRWIPEHIRELADDPAALKQAATDRIVSTAQRYRGHITDWDVMNEPVVNHDLMDILGEQVMTEWFHLAAQADPTAARYINDYGILSAGSRPTGHQQRYFDIIQQIINEGAPLDGIGMQGHFGWNLTPPETLLAILDRFSVFGLPIRITEFDIDIHDPQLQGQYFRDFMTAVYSHPSVDGILIWGFWANRHWKPTAALFESDWTPRPQGQVWMDLIHREWTTHETARTNARGQVTFRGFHGDYDITIHNANQPQLFTTTITPEGTLQTINLK